MTGFYKDISGTVTKAEIKISTLNGEFLVEDHADYEYPLAGGWFYFDTDEEAENYFNSGVTDGVPNTISRMQMFLVLEAMELLATVDAMMANPATPRTTKIAYETATIFSRQSPLVIGVGVALGLTSDQLDQIFIAGSEISV